MCRRILRATLLAALAFWLSPGIAGADEARLIDAVKRQDRAAIRALLDRRVDVNARQADGATALHWAVYKDDAETVDLLIHAGARVDAANDLGVTPIALACVNGVAPMVQRLLAAHANPNATWTGEPVLLTAARSGSVTSVKGLLNYGADVNATDTVRGQTALMWAAAHGHFEVVGALLEAGADVHARSRVSREVVASGNRYSGVATREEGVKNRAVAESDYGGSTALLFAARQGDVRSARLLLVAGAQVNETAPDGTSALVIASHSGHGAMAAFLLEHGADPNASDAGYTALHAAILRGEGPLVRQLLERGADADAPIRRGTPSRRYSKDFALNDAWKGATPLWLASRFAELEILQTLAVKGATVQVRTSDGATPLIAAIAAGIDSGPSASDRRDRRLDPVDLALLAERRDDEERLTLSVVKALVGLGVDVNAANSAGDTALHLGAGKGLNSVVQFLVENGAALELKNKRGYTALTALTSSRAAAGDNVRPDTADLLRALGAKP